MFVFPGPCPHPVDPNRPEAAWRAGGRPDQGGRPHLGGASKLHDRQITCFFSFGGVFFFFGGGGGGWLVGCFFLKK